LKKDGSPGTLVAKKPATKEKRVKGSPQRRSESKDIRSRRQKYKGGTGAKGVVDCARSNLGGEVAQGGSSEKRGEGIPGGGSQKTK